MSSDPTRRGPLEGTRVLEFAHFVAGPSAGLALSDLGADVIKIERPQGDNARLLGEHQAVFRQWNGGKRSIAVDLKSESGRRTAKDLCASADVVIESFRPGAMDRLGLGYADLKAVNERIVFASVSGFGEHESVSGRAGVDAIIQAESGMMHVTGEPDGRPLKVGFQVVDTACGLALSQAILAALFDRERNGHGARIAVSLFNVATYLQAHQFTEYSITDTELERSGNSVSYGYPTDLFETADGAVEAAAYLPGHWNALCDLLGLDIADDERFRENLDRIRHSDVLFPILNEAFKSRTTDEWVEALGAAGLMVGRVANYYDIYHGHLAKVNDTFAHIEDPEGGAHAVVMPPYRSSTWPPPTRTRAPYLDEHGHEFEQGVQASSESGPP